MRTRVIVIFIPLLLSACITSQPLTLDDTFEDELSSAEGEKESVHMGFAPQHFSSDKVVFDKYQYFQAKPWKSGNTQTVELGFREHGTEATFCSAVHDCLDYTFLPVNVHTHPILCVTMSAMPKDKSSIFDVQVGLLAAKKKHFPTSSIYLPQEHRMEEYTWDLRDLCLRHPDVNWKKVTTISFCINTKEQVPAQGSLLISEIVFKRAGADR